MKALRVLGFALFAILVAAQLVTAQRLKPIPHPLRQPGEATIGAQALSFASASSPWTPLTNQPSFLLDGAANPILMTDGTVLVQNAAFPDWWKLTPDKFGSYVNGAWTQVASTPDGYSPLYHSSAVLPDGRLIIEGGEYLLSADQTALVATWTPLGAIYDPLADTWRSVVPPAFFTGFGKHPQTIGDAQSVVLANGTYMQANCCTKESALLDAKTLTWTPTGTGKFDINDEEGWTLLPNKKVLTVDAYVLAYDATATGSEIYNPKSGTWTSAGSTIAQLWDSCGGATAASQEVGPGVLRPDGTVFYTGANGCGAAHTAIYNSYSGKWKAGPDFPGNLSISDGPAALETNGKVLMMASPGDGSFGAAFFEWDGKNLTQVPGTPNAPGDKAFFGNMLVLPTGQILLTDFSNDIEIFTPAASHRGEQESAPLVVFTPLLLSRGSSHQIFGFRFNGMSQAAAYGDDVQAASNYPLVRITNVHSGHVFYSRTHDHSSMAVASDDLVSTHFDIPDDQEKGFSKLEVVANGIASPPVFVFIQ